eukprot:3603240-Rhodomonas_salina.3
MKLIVHPETDKVLGIHMVGADSGEIIQLAVSPRPLPRSVCVLRVYLVCAACARVEEAGVAMKAGATKEHFDSTIGVHPTSAEVALPLPPPSRPPNNPLLPCSRPPFPFPRSCPHRESRDVCGDCARVGRAGVRDDAHALGAAQVKRH